MSDELAQVGQLIDKSINVCMTLLRQKRYQEVEAILEQALKIDPENTAILNLLGYVKMDCHEEEKVVAFLERAVAIKPDCAISHNNLATCYANQNKFDKAIYHAQTAVNLNPQSAILWNTLAVQYKKDAQPEKAIECFKKSLKLDQDPYVMVNLGNTYADKLSFDEAVSWCQKALDILPGISGAYLAMAYCHHVRGQMEEGWKAYEHRIYHFAQLIAYMSIMGEDKKWDGKADLTGKTIAVFCEQGYGDAIHFVRYVRKLKEKNCNIILNCSAPLGRLLSKVEGVDDVFLKDDVFDGKKLECDYHVPLMSLPYLLECYDPLPEPYIHIDNKPHESLRVGIAWQGSVSHPYDHLRSCSLESFKRLVMPGVQLVSLQMEPLHDPEILDYSDRINDFQDTAEIIASLDLVIAVDTSSLHLAGAMGKEAWGLIAYRPDFRWQLDRTDTIWYPSVRLFRQTQLKCWDDVMDDVVLALKKRVSDGSGIFWHHNACGN